MSEKVCPICESRSGLNMMKGEVTQLMSVSPRLPKLIDWTCGYCGHKEHDEIEMTDLGGYKTTTT